MSVTTQKKGKAVRLYIFEEDEPRLEALMKATGLTGTMIVSILASAGMKACVAAGNRMPLPLIFKIEKDCDEGERKGCSNNPRGPKKPHN